MDTPNRVYAGNGPGRTGRESRPAKEASMYIGIGTLLAIVLVILLLVLVF